MEPFGRYELVRILGRGGMAEVFLARLKTGHVAKHLAIKRLLPRYSQNPRVLRRLANEARLTVWLNHPHIVQVFDFGRIGAHYFIAMEYVDGADLRTVIAPNPDEPPTQLPVEVALDIGYQLCDALRYAHGCTDDEGQLLGIVHRDVSPHNVLLALDGHAKLADFGVAHAAVQDEQLQRPGGLFGKLNYMPPEQAKGLPCDARVDVYSAGATLFEMLTGTKPFAQSSRAEAASDRRPVPPSSLRPSLSQEIDQLVLKAMDPEPDARWQTAAELGEALAAQLTTLGGPPKPHQLVRLVREARGDSVPLRTGLHIFPTQITRPPVRPIQAAEYEPTADSLIEPEISAVRLHRESQDSDDDFEDTTSQAPRPRPDAPAGDPETEERTQTLPRPLVSAFAAHRAVVEEWLAGHARPLLAVASALLLFACGFLAGRCSVSSRPALPSRTLTVPTTAVTSPGAAGRPDAAPARRAPADSAAADVPIADARRSPDAPPVADAAAEGRGNDDEWVAEERRLGRRRRTPSKQVRIRTPRWLRKGRMGAAAWKAYISGDHRRAFALARRALRFERSPRTWAVYGASACAIGRPAAARRAHRHLTPSRRKLLTDLCSRKGFKVP